METKSKKKELKIETIGAPKFSALSKSDLNSFITCLEFQIREYYKEKNKNKVKELKVDKNR